MGKLQKLYVGIDPGKKGAFVALTKDNEVHTMVDWPKSNSFIDLNEAVRQTMESNEVYAVLERVHAMPKQGVSSMFSFGQNYGAWEMLLSVYGATYTLVPPQTWMKGLVSKNDGCDTKTCIANMCKRLYPNVVIRGPKGGLIDGRADALMMAAYAKRYFA